jgi:hypothetical protein
MIAQRPAAALLVVVVATAAAGNARADDDDAPPVSGVVREASVPGAAWEDVGSAILFVPRETLALLFVGTSMAAAILQDESTVPRFANVAEGPTRLYVFPTAFVETERTVSLGARMIGASEDVATSLRAGIGGLDDTVLESRVFFRFPGDLPVVGGFEAFFSRASALEFPGVGQVPEDDPRNDFRPGRAGQTAYYEESRSRAIVSLGVRPVDDLELLTSLSADRRSLEGSDDPALPSIDRVFEPGTVPGAADAVRVWYGELAVRLDTRPVRGGPQEGWVLETYGGVERELPGGVDLSMMRVGGSAAAHVRVVRRTNVVIPRLALDGVVPLEDAPIPFVELARQPQFRGADDRHDRVSLVGSVDYRWAFASRVGARLFVDTATVGPSVDELAIADLRWALGAGLDLWSSGTDLGSFSVAGGPDGVNVHLSFGVSSGFGDRQHRD